jgi:antitoxin YefM
MLKISFTDLRKNLKKHLSTVLKTNVPIVINEGEDNAVVVISISEYNSLHKTIHELSSKKNQERLDSAISKLKR